ncbi:MULTISPECIES: YeiH family protein [unclassified Treponema]|uniref:YeiH family protein n=1 Tax=unclassified Treponema TaxID=2638727 RepID=UPI0020A44FE8|nr:MULTISPECIES: putative sulfate exporter family transporter [unclassified Treponema]UTC66102.1 putative sulfate exporter family transporter [Treponema sp. OMZ 789]UTC68831.1 putative sulfate exporter family transporter [Treponema sp. OMZ 790]UTC71559.1 putative sulfate exporter family transporter [Treponema sp. OMZ 791]
MQGIKKNISGILVCSVITVPAWVLGKLLPVAGSPVIALIIGMLITLLWKDKGQFGIGITFVSKKVLQWAVVLLGAGLNYTIILKTGIQSLPIIMSTIAASLLVSFILYKAMQIEKNTAMLIGVGSSICGGSAVAAAASVIDADSEEAAQAISVIFFFNVLAALIFPTLGRFLGFDTHSGEAFGIFAGTAVNDTSSVTAAAAVWDSMWILGSQTLDKAVTVKLTRTLAIIPITFTLAFLRARELKRNDGTEKKVRLKNIFPMFILYFIGFSIVSAVLSNFGVPSSAFKPVKTLSKIFITAAMAGVGLNSNIVKLIKTGGKPLFLGASCWIVITAVSLIMQQFLGIW